MAAEWLKRLTVVASLLLLSSCYIPDKFRAELRLSRFGDYDMIYKGDLMWAPILDDYRKGRITPDNESERLENIRKDLSRDIAFRKIEPRGRGRFAVEYERAGRLAQVQLVSLIRRDVWKITGPLDPASRLAMVRDPDPRRPLPPPPPMPGRQGAP